MINDNLKLRGKLSIAINDKIVKETDNLVVTAGKGYVASRMKDATATALSHMAVGTSTANPAVGDTTLGTEIARVALTSTTVSGVTVVYVGTYPAGTGTGALTESGILNASSGGTLFCRTEFGVINKSASDSMTITWTITVS